MSALGNRMSQVTPLLAQPTASKKSISTSNIKIFDIVELSQDDLCKPQGILLGRLGAQSHVEPLDVTNARFQVNSSFAARFSKTEVLTDTQYDCKMSRLLKCIKAEGDFEKFLRKENMQLYTSEAKAQMIKKIKNQRSKFERERFKLMDELNLNTKRQDASPWYSERQPPQNKTAIQFQGVKSKEQVKTTQYKTAAYCKTNADKPKANGRKQILVKSKLSQSHIAGNYIVPPKELQDKVKAKLLALKASSTYLQSAEFYYDALS